jgi:predicted DNA-binding WGR domain protein
VRWGTIGEEGAVSEKEHADDATAAKFVAKKIAEKEKGGYTKCSGS